MSESESESESRWLVRAMDGMVWDRMGWGVRVSGYEVVPMRSFVRGWCGGSRGYIGNLYSGVRGGRRQPL